jgi:uncharacterized protein YfaP (DUF2135 family)
VRFKPEDILSDLEQLGYEYVRFTVEDKGSEITAAVAPKHDVFRIVVKPYVARLYVQHDSNGYHFADLKSLALFREELERNANIVEEQVRKLVIELRKIAEASRSEP